MERTLVKAFFDACHYARHITDALHTLPDGVAPHHVYTIGAIHSLSQTKSGATIAEVAAYLGVSNKTAGYYLRDLYHKGLLHKVESAAISSAPRSNDAPSNRHTQPPSKSAPQTKASSARHIRLSLTDAGREYHTRYVEKYYDRMMDLFKGISNNDMNIAIRVIKQAYYLMMNSDK